MKTITLNTRFVKVKNKLTYREIINLAYGVMADDTVVYTVDYFHQDGDGSVSPGQTLKVQDAMAIRISNTGGA